MNINLKIKVLPGGTLPQWGDHGNAGLDLHAVGSGVIPPKCLAVVHLGICTEFSPTYVAYLKDRSGMAAKGLHLFGGVIDSSYRGEWKAVIYNSGCTPYHITAGDRVCQAVFHSVFHLQISEVNENTTDLSPSVRGQGGFGSTGI